MSKLFRKYARVNFVGHAVIPPETDEICGAFDGNRELRTVCIPGTVKRIGLRAFADCVNLSKVVLAEGIEVIEANVFTGCSNLAEVVMPDSIRDCSNAFYECTGLRTPVYNRSGNTLYAYPYSATDKRFIVPHSVRHINQDAFAENPYLEEVVLPEGLEIIRCLTFESCGIQKIVIPKSVKRIEARAFWSCRFLKEVVVLGENTVIADGAFYRCPLDMQILCHRKLRIDERLRILGSSLLACVRPEYPSGEHMRSPSFVDLAKRCGKGDPDAMWAMGNFFAKLGEHPFFSAAANFWRFRSGQKGYPIAEKWLVDWIAAHPGKQMASILNESMAGSYNGRTLCYAGFPFFDPEREYRISKPDCDGVVEVSSWCGDDGPDEDGFGREEYYDWWYLDENLNEISGIAMIRSHSLHDKRTNEEKFKALHDAAANAIREKKITKKKNAINI